MTKLYYECHITIEPVFDERLREFKRIAGREYFRVANLLMKRSNEDPEQPSQIDSFCTARSNDWDTIVARMLRVIEHLKENNFKVLRYKIEDTLIDSRINDEYGVIL
jgi:hypothetical protein